MIGGDSYRYIVMIDDIDISSESDFEIIVIGDNHKWCDNLIYYSD